MATVSFQDRVEDYLGTTVSDTAALSSFLTDAAKSLVDIVPLERFKRSAVLSTIGSSTGTVTVGTKHILPGGVLVSGKVAREVPYERAGDVTSSASIYYRSLAEDPAYYLSSGSLHVANWVNGTVGTVLYVPYPTVSYTDESITAWPSELEEPVVIGAALRYMTKLMEVERAKLETLSTELAAALPEAPVLDARPPDELDVESHLDKIHEFINTNEDIELAQGEAQEIAARVQAYNTQLQLYATTVNGYAAEAQGYAAEISGTVQAYAARRDLAIASIQAFTQTISNLRRLYYDSLKMLTGANLEGQQPQ